MAILNIAHRGYSGKFDENTMLAFKKAIEYNADGIETDVQLTKAGVPILIHDETIDRTTNGHGFVIDYTLDELNVFLLSLSNWLNFNFLVFPYSISSAFSNILAFKCSISSNASAFKD